MDSAERQQHVEQLHRLGVRAHELEEYDLEQACDAGIAALKREEQEDEEDAAAAREALAETGTPVPWEQVKEQMEAQLALDLEPVRQLIHEASINPMTGADTISVCLAAQTALPALKTLLAEVERLREENAELGKLSERRAAFKDALEEAVGLVAGCSAGCDCEGILKRRLACIR